MDALTRRLLIASVRPDPEPCLALLHEHADRLDWERLLDRAAAHKVAALLAGRVAASGVDSHLSTRVRQRLEVIRTKAAAQAARARWTLERVATAFAEEDVPLLLVKGSVLAEKIYGTAALRPFFDVDIVVRPDTLDRAERVLRSLGYRFAPVRVASLRWQGVRVDGAPDDLAPDDVLREACLRVHQHLGFMPPDDRLLPLELHWQLRRPGLMTDPEGVLWHYAEPATVTGVATRILSPDAMLVHAAVHVMSDSIFAFRLLHLADVAWLLAARAPGTAAESVWQMAQQWGATSELGCALQALEELLGLDLGCRLDYRRYLGPAWRGLFRKVATARALVDQSHPRGGWAGGVCREALWDIGKRRMPHQAMAAVRMSVLSTFRRVVSGARDEAEPDNVAPDSMRRLLGSDLAELVLASDGVPVEIAPLTTSGGPVRDHASYLVRWSHGLRRKARLARSPREAHALDQFARALDPVSLPRVTAREGAALMFEWIDGRTLTPDLWSPARLRRCGALQATLHTSPVPAGFPRAADLFADGWQEQVARHLDDLARQGAIPRPAARVTLKMTLDHAPTHAARGCAYRTFGPEQLIVNSADQVFLVDGDGITEDHLDLDLARTLQAWPLATQQREAFLEGYAEGRSLESYRMHLPFWSTLATIASREPHPLVTA